MRKRPLQFHLIALVLLAVVPIAAVSSLVFVVHARKNQEAAERALIETTRAVAIATEYRVEAEVKRLETLARSARLAVDDLNGFKREAQNAVFTGQFLEVLLLDPNGYIVLNASTEGLNSSNSRVHDAPYLEMVRETLLPHVSDVVSLPISARNGIVLSVPVLRSGQLAYVLVGAPHTSDKLLDLFSQQRLPAGGIGTIMDRNGVYIARTLNPNESVGRQASASYRAHALRASEGIVKNLNPEGIAVYGTFVHTRHGWITALALPADQVEAPHLQSIFTMAALWLSTITIGIIAAVLVGRRITASLGRLSEAAVEVGKGSVPASRPEPVSEVDRVRESLIQAANQRDQLLAEYVRAREAADAANRAKDEFLAMLGHELRNPIGTIANAISALTLVNKDDQQGAPMREVIQRQVIHLSTLVDDLLDASRLITGKIVLRRQPMNLTAAVQRCAQVLAMHRTLLQTSVQAEEDVWIDGDETRIEQVINNLISNAIKYTPEGGEVVVRLAHADGRAALSVADTGIGIPQQLLPHVFDLFVQGPTQGLERARGGLGIGLTVVKRLVELHDGTVEVSSEGAGRGSTFTVCLPTIQPASVKTQPEGSFTRDASVSPKRILIIEDQADQREALRLALSLRGHVVYAAADGGSGVALVEGERPDVVIVDIGLPHMDGYEVARRIRTLSYGAAVRLVALTGYGQPEDRARAQEAGFDLHLVKPVDNQRLDQVLGNQ